MARGWESKSVEAQQADAADRPKLARLKMSAQQAHRQRQLDGLDLSRRRVLQQLSASHDPRHRPMLEQALADLDRKIQKLTDL